MPTTDFSLRDGRKLSSQRNDRLPFHYVELPLGREGAAVTVAGRNDGSDQPSDWALHLLPR